MGRILIFLQNPELCDISKRAANTFLPARKIPEANLNNFFLLLFQVLISDLLNFLVVVAGPADTGPDTQPRAQDPDQGEGRPTTEERPSGVITSVADP